MFISSTAEGIRRRSVGLAEILHVAACVVVCAQLATSPAGWAAAENERTDATAAKPAISAADAKKMAADPVLKVMQGELSRANT
jgi:hypothetical protein